jgi:hypothetical protein
MAATGYSSVASSTVWFVLRIDEAGGIYVAGWLEAECFNSKDSSGNKHCIETTGLA